ncbi:hypothetical protein JCM16138_08420 [Thermococcus atlanticus]
MDNETLTSLFLTRCPQWIHLTYFIYFKYKHRDAVVISSILAIAIAGHPSLILITIYNINTGQQNFKVISP